MTTTQQWAYGHVALMLLYTADPTLLPLRSRYDASPGQSSYRETYAGFRQGMIDT